MDYLSDNAISKYPFNDSASLIDLASHYLAEDVIVDVVFGAKQKEPVSAQLYSYIWDGTTFTFIFGYSDKDAIEIDTLELTVPAAGLELHKMYYASNDDVYCKLVVGPGLISALELSSFSRDFDGTAHLNPNAFILFTSTVKTVGFYNWVADGDCVGTGCHTLVTTLSIDDLTIKGGTNTEWKDTDTGAALDVIAGLGAGLYDDCDANLGYETVPIKTINDLGGTKDLGRFIFSSSPCFSRNMTAITDGNGVHHTLTFQANCGPACGSGDYVAIAHYLNRITDGLTREQAYVKDTVKANIEQSIADFNAGLLKANRNKPTVKYEFLVSTILDQSIYSIVIGFFNSTPDPIELTAGFSAQCEVISGALTFGDQTVTAANSAIGTTIPCLTAAIFKIVIMCPNSGGGVFNCQGMFGTVPFNITI